MKKWLIGIDEAGRGPLAGPVAVGAVLIPADFDWEVLVGVNDSKKLSHHARTSIYEAAKVLKKEGKLDHQVALVRAAYIDSKGIVPAVNSGMARILRALIKRNQLSYEDVYVKLDGSLYAPEAFLHQETIIKGDAKEKCIGLASILAKVTRDRYMMRSAGKYPEYQFEIHKGYGTKAHRALIEANGLSPLHRTSFCRNLRV